MSEGKKFDCDKLKVHLLYKTLVEPLEDVAKVLTFGADKYGEDNWQNLDNGFDRYYAAFIRHTNARVKGETLDPESGLPHLAHAACCLLFMMFLDRKPVEVNPQMYTGIIGQQTMMDNNGIHHGNNTSKFSE